jgi:hypothetical protein
MNRIIELYSTIVACPNTSKECPNTINDPATGNLPRGFYTQAERPEDVVALLVAKNPGHPFKDEINGAYRGITPADQVRKHFELQQSFLYPSAEWLAAHRRSLTFSLNLRRYMSYFLDIPEDQIFKKCACTNLVKCSSPGEQDPLHKTAIHECLTRHFLREIALFSNVKLIIAFGGEVAGALKKRKVKAKHGKPIVCIRHPSYYYRKEEEATILAKLKEEIVLHLKGGANLP